MRLLFAFVNCTILKPICMGMLFNNLKNKLDGSTIILMLKHLSPRYRIFFNQIVARHISQIINISIPIIIKILIKYVKRLTFVFSSFVEYRCKYVLHNLHFTTLYQPYVLLRVAGSCCLRLLFIADVGLPACGIGLPMVFREQPTRES